MEPVSGAEKVPGSEFPEAGGAMFGLGPLVAVMPPRASVRAEVVFYITEDDQPVFVIQDRLESAQLTLMERWVALVERWGTDEDASPVTITEQGREWLERAEGVPSSEFREAGSDDDEQRPVSAVATSQTHITSGSDPATSVDVAKSEPSAPAVPNPADPKTLNIRHERGYWWMTCPVHARAEGVLRPSEGQGKPAHIECRFARAVDDPCETRVPKNVAEALARANGGAV